MWTDGGIYLVLKIYEQVYRDSSPNAVSFKRVYYFAPTRVWFRNKKIARFRRKQCTLSEESLFIVFDERDN